MKRILWNHPIISSNTGINIKDLKCERKNAVWNINDIILQCRL